MLLLFLIVGNVVFDGIGIAAATADETEVKRLSKHCGRSEKIAIYIVENADIVSNVCNDVIGDIFGILSGACTVVITASVTKGLDTVTGKLVAVAVSAIISAIIVGGKAALKTCRLRNLRNSSLCFQRYFRNFCLKNERKKRNDNPRKK